MFGDKLRQIRTHFNMSQKEFAALFNISYGALQNYEYGATQPKPALLEAVAKHFDIDMSFFYTKNGSKFTAPLSAKDDESGMETVNLRLFENISASAGYGANNEDESWVPMPVSKEFLTKILKVAPIEYDVIKVVGDSMEPFVKDGELALVQRGIEPKNGDIIIVNLSGDLYIKKLFINPVENIIKLTSLNEFYQDIVLNNTQASDLKVIGKVAAKFSMNMKIF